MARAANIPFHHLLEGQHGRLRTMRFWSKVDMRTPEECWDWQASLNHHGYGRFKLCGNLTIHANRMAWALSNGRDPGEMMVLHACDRPKCCNPHHLRLGTVQDNADDMMSRGRHRTPNQAGSANGNAKIDEEVLATVIERLKAGMANTAIAADLPVGHALVSRIRTGRSWRAQAEALGWSPRPQFVRKRAA